MRENNPLFYICIIMREDMVKIGEEKVKNTNKSGKIKKRIYYFIYNS